MSLAQYVNLSGGLDWLMVDRLARLNQEKLAKVSTGSAVLDLSMINPDIEPPRLIIDKLVESSLHADRHRYAVSRGVRKLREAFALKYRQAFGVRLDPEHQICVSMGAKDAVVHALMCLAVPGGRALIGSPAYPAHLSALHLADFAYDFFELSSDEDRMLAEIERALAAERYHVVLMNFPNNPTGAVVSARFYERLHAIAAAAGVFLLNDFVYGEMLYDGGAAVSLLSVPGAAARAAEVYSLSKAYSVPGWRVGALAGNEELVKALWRLKAQIDYGIFLPIQEAAAAALAAGPELIRPQLERYRRRCNTLVNGLSKLGWSVARPAAGASVWAAVPADLCGGDAETFALELLQREGVMLLPGAAFGADYAGYVRFALVVSEEKLHGVISSLRSFSSWKRGGLQHACANS